MSARVWLAAIVLVSLATLAVASFETRRVPLIDRDEGRYAEVAREMLEAREWLVPRLFGVAYLEKPPLFYWLTAASYSVFGEDELGARFVSALAAALGVLATGLFARRYCGGRAGLFAALVLATSGLYFVLARVVITDMLFAVLVAGALMAYRGAEHEGRSFLPFWMLAAAATLTKGPVAAVLCALTIIGHLAAAGTLRRLLEPRFWSGVLVYLLLVVPWFALLEVRFPGFLGFYVYKEHVLRAAGDEHREAFYWYVPWVLAGFLPWTPAWIASLPGILRRAQERSVAGETVRFTLVWAAAVLGFFSIPRGKLVPYILPLLPALAIQLGDALDRWLALGAESRALHRAFLLVGLSLVVVAALLAPASRYAPGISAATVALGVFVVLCAGAVTIALHRRLDASPIVAIAATIVILECAAVSIAAPIVRLKTTLPIVEILRSRLGADDAVASYGGYFPNLPFYLRRVPYFVFGNRELDFGVSLEGNGPWIVDRLATLRARLGDRRIFFVLRTRERDLQALLALPGRATLLHRGRTSSLVEYQP